MADSAPDALSEILKDTPSTGALQLGYDAQTTTLACVACHITQVKDDGLARII